MRAIAAFALLCSTVDVVSEPLRVRIVPADESAAMCRGSVGAHEWTAGESLLLDTGRPALVTLQSADCWAPPLLLDRGDEATIHVWRKQTLRGRVAVPRGDLPPTMITTRIGSPPKTSVAVPPTDIECHVENAVVTCDVPAAMLDLRFTAEGFAPSYRWDVAGRDLGELRLSRGTVVTGYAGSSRGLPAGVAVELRPASLAWSPEDHQRLDVQARTTKTNARGFFQFADVEPGEYVAIARHEGWSPAEQRLVVRDGRTEEPLAQELVLGELGRIEVAIQPPTDPQQQPWKVILNRVVSGDAQSIAESTATLTGEWQHAGLKHGAYSVEVTDAEGKRVAREGVGVWGGRQFIAITIDQVVVRGMLSKNDHPVEAKLEFFDIDGRRIWMNADAEGDFTGMLPAQGKWSVGIVREGTGRIEIASIDVRRSDAKGFAELDLRLPEGRVGGVVVNADGEPVDARVRLWRNSRAEAFGRFKDGTFEFDGVATGEVELWADARDGESGLIPHTIRRGKAEPLKIVVAKRNTVRGMVVSPEGRPIAGAEVVWLATYYVQSAFTGPRGQFKIDLAPSETHVDVGVVAVGHPLKVVRLDARAEEAQSIRLMPIAGQIFIPMFTGKGSTYPAILAGGLRPLPLGAMLGNFPPPQGLPVRIAGGGFVVDAEPGPYRICANSRLEHCEAVTLHSGARVTVDTSEWPK